MRRILPLPRRHGGSEDPGLRGLFFGGDVTKVEDRRMFFDRHAASWNAHNSDGDHARFSGLVGSFGLTDGDAVLDVGTGTGVLLPFIREKVRGGGRLVAIDFSFKMLERASNERAPTGAFFLNASVEAIPFRSEYFDFVTCFAAFPHFPDKGRALGEMMRVLRSGGTIAIAHLKSAEEINNLHGQIGGAVANDRLPHGHALKHLMQETGLHEISVRNEPGLFLALGTKR